MNPGDRIYLKTGWRPVLHPEVEPLDLPRGTEGIIDEPDRGHPALGKVLVTFPAYNFHWAFEADELANLFTQIVLPSS